MGKDKQVSFTSIHNHTYASNQRFIDSINRPEQMVEKAIKLGFSGMAFTDHESLSLGVTLLKLRDKIKETNPDFKIIFGNEIYLIPDEAYKNTKDYYHFILIAKDSEGYQQLKQLSSRAWERSYFERGVRRCPTLYSDFEEIIKKNPGHLIGSSACLGSEIDKAILARDSDTLNTFIPWCVSVFGGDNFFLEIQAAGSEEQITCNKYLVQLSKHFDIDYIITTDSHYLDKEGFALFSAFLNSKSSSDREAESFYKYTYIMSIEEMSEILGEGGMSLEEIEKGINNTQKIYDMVEDFDFRHSTIVPSIILPSFTLSHQLQQWYEQYPMIKHYAYSNFPQDQYLFFQIEKGLLDREVKVTEEILDRINVELGVLLFISKKIKQDVSAYLNLAVSMVNIAWQVSLVGCGRGSACGFFINYLIGITQVDPLKYDLPYWRFLNKERAEMPDIDSDFQTEKIDDIVSLFRSEYGEDNVLNCATFKTESLKSAILTCARGLQLNNDVAQSLAALVPSHRGITYSLQDCLIGDPEKGLEPVPNFEYKLREYPGLFEMVQKIESLPTNASIHASALYVFNDSYLKHNSLMRAPSGTRMTAFSMHDSDDMGALKMDILRTDAMSKMAKCLDLLLKDNQIEWQGSLRATYDKYLHPDVLEYNDPVMWQKASNGEISNLFQFETQVGSVCIQKAQPNNVIQLAAINSIMRLQSEGKEQPIDRYVRFRNNIKEWYSEMAYAGLTIWEEQILEKYLKGSFGVAGTQEDLMQLVMDPAISGFSLGDANSFRKAIAKKNPADILKNQRKFFKQGKSLGTSEKFLKYVWDQCIEPQCGYAFSRNHTLPYSIIGLQEMNLATRWNPLYWISSCLCINAGTGGANFDDDDDEEVVEVDIEGLKEGTEDKKEKTVAPNYAKIAKAISDVQLAGVHIRIPDINTSDADFIPDIENNAILYGLLAVSVVNKDLYARIIANRPFTSISDVVEKVQPTNIQMIGLIKAGCLDSLYPSLSRQVIMKKYLQYYTDLNITKKTKMTIVQIRQSLDLDMDLSSYKNEVRLFKFKQYIDQHQNDKKNKRYILTDSEVQRFFSQFIQDKLNVAKGEWSYLPDNAIMMKTSSFERLFKVEIAPLIQHLSSEEGVEKFYRAQQDNFISEIENKYCSGTIEAWEMETLSCYINSHELSGVNTSQYNIRDFNTLPEIPEDYKTYCMAGTVVGFDNSRHLVNLLTVYGVVNVKFYSNGYILYNQIISHKDPKTQKKTVIDDSWFKRGNKLLIYGTRRENMFIARNDRSSGYNRMVCLIETVRSDGTLGLRCSRNKK